MSPASFELFKVASMTSFANALSDAEDIAFEAAFENASEQFHRLVYSGLETSGQRFDSTSE
jgi:hypothetical protein